MNKIDFKVLVREIQNIGVACGGTFGGEVVDLIWQLKLLSKKHNKLCERYCNEQNFEHLLIEKCEVKIDNTANKLNAFLKGKLSIEKQQDPRGNTIKVNIGEQGLYEIFHLK